MSQRPRRSALYMPASNARAIEKARALPADVVILDLEDAVAPEAKADARGQAVAAVRDGGFGRREVVIRCNGLDTPWGAEDLAQAAACGPDAILVPKISSPEDLLAYRKAIGGPKAPPLWGMIETCAAVLNLREIAAAARGARLDAFVAGSNDLAKEMGCRPGPRREPLQPILVSTILAARSAGLAALDGVCNALDDSDALDTECRQGADLGFDGKTLIHPGQIETANRAFSPDPAEVAFARAVVRAFADPQNANKGAIRIDGRMAERLHLAQAEKLVALAEALDLA